MRILGRAVVVAIPILLALAATPYLTTYQMKIAGQNKDADALSRHIDYPRLRQSFKQQIDARVSARVDADDKLRKHPLAALGKALAGSVSDAMVDAYITPERIRQMMAGRVPAVMDETPRPSTEGPPDEEGESDRQAFDRIDLGYRSFDRFVVRVERDGKDIDFVLHRQGLRWKLSEILLPGA